MPHCSGTARAYTTKRTEHSPIRPKTAACLYFPFNYVGRCRCECRLPLEALADDATKYAAAIRGNTAGRRCGTNLYSQPTALADCSDNVSHPVSDFHHRGSFRLSKPRCKRAFAVGIDHQRVRLFRQYSASETVRRPISALVNQWKDHSWHRFCPALIIWVCRPRQQNLCQLPPAVFLDMKNIVQFCSSC